jgi:hypothetical protein
MMWYDTNISEDLAAGIFIILDQYRETEENQISQPRYS